jgi:hypothetical protein
MLVDFDNKTAAIQLADWALDEGCLDECIVFSDMVDAVAAARARFEDSWRAELADTLEEEMAYA